jgi:hypothetical protein
MRLATVTKLSLSATAVLTILTGVFIRQEQSNVAAERAATTRAAEFKQLGLELAKASDYLTDEVRFYTVTGEKTYFDNYWREVNETRSRDRVITQLKALGATADELALIDQAKSSSDALIRLEESAMQAVADG